MKALKINVKTQEIENITISEDYTEIYKKIGNGCNLFCCPIQFENGDVLYADDEALFQENLEGCFSLPNFKYPIVGNAIILGSKGNGDSDNVKTKPEDLDIIFGNNVVAEEYRRNAIMQRPEIITF